MCSRIPDGERSLVIFHWKDCGACHRMYDSLNRTKGWREKIRKHIYLVELEYKACESEIIRQGIRSFPTIRLYDGYGNYDTYSGERDVAHLLKYVKQS